MDEADNSTEEIGGITQKDSREIINQLTRTYYSKEAAEVVGCVGYDNKQVWEALRE